MSSGKGRKSSVKFKLPRASHQRPLQQISKLRLLRQGD
jgi:hypothetical protein